MAFSQRDSLGDSTWRSEAVDRSLVEARRRSEARVQRLLDAARELSSETQGAEFTVADVAARASVALKSFYRCFEGKDELILALLDEESRVGAEILRQQLDRVTPERRLEVCVKGIFELALTKPGYASVLCRQHRRLSIEHADRLTRALQPLAGVIEHEIQAATGGTENTDPVRATEIVFGLLIDGLADVTVAGRDSEAVATSVWNFIAGGLGLRSSEADGTRRRN